MERTIINIDEEKCDGCGECVPSCAEGAIQIINGKARLLSENYCDGLGACIGECPQGALTIEVREAPDFDKVAVVHNLAAQRIVERNAPVAVHQGCPGAAMRELAHDDRPVAAAQQPSIPSQLGHWPVQLMLVPPHAPFLKNADLLVCADCVPFAVPDFHSRYLAGRAVLVGCPKLDNLPFYVEKLKAIFAEAKPRRITVLRMEVPCCGGIAQAAIVARNEVAPPIPLTVHTVGIRGAISAQTVSHESQGDRSTFNIVG